MVITGYERKDNVLLPFIVHADFPMKFVFAKAIL